MLTGAALSVTGARIALFSKSNEFNMADALVRLASGKRVNRPSDSIPDFFYSEKMERESCANTQLLRGIGEGMAFVDVAASAGEQVFNGINGMHDLIERYYRPDTTSDEQNAMEDEFNALKMTVTTLISSSNYDGDQIISDNGGTPFKSVVIDANDLTQRLDISFDASDIADVSALTIGVTDEATESAAAEAELGKAGAYLAKTAGYLRGLTAHYNLTNNKQR